jgi:L-alanine-DL-glutamate epimerase-like enolase superfamily enzyme
MALWDLAGRALELPVYKLLGAYRDKVLAYASTMCGDDMEGGLNTPEAYADFAEECKNRGYKALKLHTWFPPIEGAPDPKRDIAACRAIRERVGDDMVLMLDSYHNYTREEALFLGRELEKLNFAWIEEPMNEYSISSYVWLTEQLDIPVLGPETAIGRVQTRAEWIMHKAADIVRAGVSDVGGITPVMKAAGLAESFGMSIELHGGGPGNLQALGAIRYSRYYERGLLHPFVDYETPRPYPQKPGLGLDINLDYIEANRIEA